MFSEQLGAVSLGILIESIHSVVLVFDSEGKLQTWNSAATEALALHPGAPGATVQPDLGPQVAGLVSVCLNRRRPARIEQTELPIAGRTRLFGFTASPVQVNGRVVGALVTGRDITDKVEIDSAVEDLKRRSDSQAVTRKVVHELRNPIHIIRGYAQYMKLALEAANPAREYTDIIVAETDRMDRVLEGLKEFSRARNLEFQYTSPEPALRKAGELARSLMEEKALAFEGAIPADLSPIPHDPLRLEQVIVSLLRNAAEAASPGGHVTLRASDTPDFLRIEVEDDGPGLDPSVEPRLFGLFETTKAEKGRGLGLAISREIIQEHGGEITYTSRAGLGTCFRVQIPRP